MSGQKPKSERNKPLMLDDAAFDALTALIAVRDGLASEAQVEEALAEKKKSQTQDTSVGADAPKPKRLAFILADMGVLDEAQAKELEKRLDPEVLPGYRILGEAGRGGMGTVFKARQLSMDRVVALKILANRLSKDERWIEKFLQEARAAGKLNHENIVSAIDCGAASGFHYFVMEFVDGKTAMEILAKEGALPWEKAFEYAESVARALEHAHANGLVHRDVKPENIMVSQTVLGTRVKLCDLGLAKEAVEAGTGEKSKMTEATPAYASPEQALGRTDIDARSDIYSLGATIYHLLANEAPFDGENARTILWKQVHKPFPDLDQKLPNVPVPLRKLIASMVEKDRDKRLASARAFLDELALARAAVNAPSSSGPIEVVQPQAKARSLAVAVGVLLAVAIPVAIVGSRVTAPQPADPPVATNDPTKNPKPPEDKGDTKPKIVHVGDDDPSDKPDKRDTGPGTETDPKSNDPKTGSSDNADEKARAAQLLLDRANQFHEQSPDDIQGYATKLRAVVDRYPGTPAAAVASADLKSLNVQGQEAILKDLEQAMADAQALSDKGKFKEAVAALDALGEKWDAKILAPAKPSIDKARTQILGAARKALAALVKEGDGHLAKNEAPDDTVNALATFEQGSPQPVAKEAHDAADSLRSRWGLMVADAGLKDALAKRDDFLGQGQLDDAERLVQAASKDAKLQPRKKELDAFVAETVDIGRIWRVFDEKMKGLGESPKRVYRRRTSPPLEGQLRDYDPVSWGFKVKPFGLKELLLVDVRDLVAEDVFELALPSHDPPDLRAACCFFIARREPELAALALDRAVAGGLADDPTLRARIQALLGQDKEIKAQRLAAKALSAANLTNAPEEVVNAVRALIQGYADTQTYAEKLDELKKAYAPARVARLVGADIAQVFSGKVTKNRNDVKLEYDFSKEGPGIDWIPDPSTQKDSAIHWVKGREHMKGIVRNIAVWEPGQISVDARIITPSDTRPNANIIISAKPGWEGLLVGFGFKTGNIDRIRVDPSAAKKPGWRVVTPCNIVYDLEGKAPDPNGKCLAAEETPAAGVGRPLHYKVNRDTKGAIHCYLGSQNPIYLDKTPHSDEAGSVAIAGLETEIGVEHVEILGRLDSQWLADRARALADAEVAKFPAPVKGKN